jgi:hypothetical protein
MLRITNETDEEILKDREDDGRTVSEMEQANKTGLEGSENDGGGDDISCIASCRTFSATYLFNKHGIHIISKH